MKAKRNIYDYLHYSFEDFLQDDYFIASVLGPNRQSEYFWSEYQKNIPNNDFDLAVNYLRGIQRDQPTIPLEKKPLFGKRSKQQLKLNPSKIK